MKVIKEGWLRWLGHPFRIQEQNPCRKLILYKPEGTRRVGRPAVRWLDSVEEDFKTVGPRNWRLKVIGLGTMKSNRKRESYKRSPHWKSNHGHFIRIHSLNRLKHHYSQTALNRISYVRVSFI
jgi:hypothetical protein